MDWKYEEGRIYSVNENNEILAEATFVDTDMGKNHVDINHTYVTPDLRGRGIASKMMEVLCEHLRENSKKTVASCPYAKIWLKKHNDIYSDIIAEEIDLS